MADKLTIAVAVIDIGQGEQTVSQFVVDDKAQITFSNTTDRNLAVSIEDATEQFSPLCQGNQPVPSFEVGAGDEKKLQICNDTSWTRFKYTATVENAAEEDPIVIIERSSLYSMFDLGSAVTGALIGAGVAFFLARSWKPGGTKPG